jgi:ABC-type glycerol-3-phosphate transport system substrate-binding protein
LLVGAEYGVVTPNTMTPTAKAVRDLIDKYQKSVQPGVKVELEDLTLPQGQIYYEALRLRALAGNIPDLVAFEPRPSTMNADLFYQFPRELLDKPNPYSTNKRWWDDFPYDGVALGGYTGAEAGSYWSVALTRTGTAGALGIGYNRAMFEKAGIGPVPPKSWDEFMDWHKKLKATGVIPWDAANRAGHAWNHGLIYDNLIEAQHANLDETAATFFGDKASGMLSPKQVVYLLRTKKWTFDDEYTAAYYDIHKEWSQYYQPGALAQSTKSYFLSGEAAMTFGLIENVYQWERDLQGKFKWGMFVWPSITQATWSKAPGLPQRPAGATGFSGSYARGAMFQIPQKTVKSGRLDLALDFLYWLTAPAQLQDFSKTVEPRSAMPGQTVKEVYPEDPEKQEHWRFVYEPPGILNGKRYGWDEWWNLAGPGFEEPLRNQSTGWLSGQIGSSKAAATALQKLAMEATDRWVAQNPDFKPPPATWK